MGESLLLQAVARVVDRHGTARRKLAAQHATDGRQVVCARCGRLKRRWQARGGTEAAARAWAAVVVPFCEGCT